MINIELGMCLLALVELVKFMRSGRRRRIRKAKTWRRGSAALEPGRGEVPHSACSTVAAPVHRLHAKRQGRASCAADCAAHRPCQTRHTAGTRSKPTCSEVHVLYWLAV